MKKLFINKDSYMGNNVIKKNEVHAMKTTSILDTLLNQRGLTLFLLVILISIAMSILFPESYFSYQNLAAVLLSLSMEGVLAIGMMYLIVSGVFDLSVGSNVALGGVICAYMLKHWANIPIPIAVLAGISVSAVAGLVNGFLVAKLKINALIATLAMMGVLRGIAILIAGSGISGLPERFTAIGQVMFVGLQVPVYYLIFLVVLSSFLLAKTRYFRQLYFIGGNIKAAELSGINTVSTLIVNFIIMGLLAGISGVVIAARLRTAIGNLGAGVEMRVITAVIIGGGSLAGGRGDILGAFMGALFMGVLNNVMVIAGVNVYYQSIVIGLVLIGAVSIDAFLQRKYGGVR